MVVPHPIPTSAAEPATGPVVASAHRAAIPASAAVRRHPTVMLEVELPLDTKESPEMSHFVIVEIRLGPDGEPVMVRWRSASPSTNGFLMPMTEVGIDAVVEALDRGDTVHLRFLNEQGHAVSGGQVRRKVHPDGTETVEDHDPQPGRTLRDLPRF